MINKKSVSRRRFLETSFKTLFAVGLIPYSKFTIIENSLILEPRKRIPNPYITRDGKPILVCIEGIDFGRMLERGLEILGGLNRLIGYNQNVLIKPNLVIREDYPITSSSKSIKKLIRTLQNVTTGIISVGDQGWETPEFIYPYLNLINAVIGSGANLVAFSNVYPVRCNSWNLSTPYLEVYSEVYDAPIIINLCSLKRHSQAYLTCALKNNIGTITGPEATGTRAYLHAKDHSSGFLEAIAEIAGLINPELNIIDARLIMTIDGPLLKEASQIKRLNKIIICGDMVATDTYCAKLMEENDETFLAASIMPTLKRAEQLGLGTSNLDEVEIIETDVERNYLRRYSGGIRRVDKNH